MPKRKYDCVIIGSGPGGAPFAWRLASRGMSVLVLEAGPRFDPSTDYHLDELDWEMQSFPHKKKMKFIFGKSQELDKDYEHLRSWNKGAGKLNPGEKRRYLEYQYVAGVGGSTLHFQGEAHRLHPAAFRMKTLYGVASDWSLQYEDLEPYYTEVEKLVGVAGPEKIPGRSMSSPYPLPPHQLSYASSKLKEGCEKLGYELLPNSVAILSENYRDNRPCNYCNGCSWGCPIKDKGSVDVTFIPLAEKTGKCEILTNVTAGRIEVVNRNGQKKAKGVQYFDKEGKEHFVEGEYIAVACGAIETPRLMLNSGINESGQVGRNFMETLFYQAAAFHPERLDSFRGIPIDSVLYEWNEPASNDGLTGGYKLFPTVGSAMGPINYALRYHTGWGEEFVKEVEKWFGHAVVMGGIGEFLPNERTFISVEENIKDDYGMPVAKIQSYLGESELKVLDHMSSKAKEILKASGADEIVEEFSAYDLFAASHVFGTCRMGDDPSQSVVNGDLRSHEVKNLLITDASVFPSSGGGDAPSLTIEALSLRAADRLLENIRNQRG